MIEPQLKAGIQPSHGVPVAQGPSVLSTRSGAESGAEAVQSGDAFLQDQACKDIGNFQGSSARMAEKSAAAPGVGSALAAPETAPMRDSIPARPPVPTVLSDVEEPALLADVSSGGVRSNVDALQRLVGSGARNGFVVDGAIGDRLDVESIKNARFLGMRLDSPGAEDAVVAAGMALAGDGKSLYLVSSRKDLPWFLREADQTYPGRVQVLEGSVGFPALAHAVESLSQATPSAPIDLDLPHEAVDTFLGCLMSGLSEAEYAEGRSHLQAIDTALRDRLGSPGNYCEGIQVGSVGTFGSPRESLAADLDAVRRSHSCVFYLYDGKSRPSGMWVELGYAMGLGKPCLLLTPNMEALPPALREKANGLEVRTYASHEKLLRQLEAAPERLLR